MSGLASQEMALAAWALIGVYVLVVLVLVVRGARTTKTINDYAVGSLAFNPVLVGMSLAASMTSAATFIIVPGLIALYGVSGVLAAVVVLPIACLGSLVIFTKKFRKHGTTVKAATLAQWIGSRYESKGYSLFFGFISLLLISFIVLVCVGLTKVLSGALNASELWVLIGLVAFIFGYMMFGGANSMVYTNAIQASLMLLVALILIGSGYDHFSSGVHGFLDRLAAIDPNLVRLTNPDSPLYRDLFEVVFCQVVVGIAIIAQPHILTKSLLLKRNRDVNIFLGVNTAVMGIFFSVICVGLYARLAFPDLTVAGQRLGPDGVMSAYVVSEFPVWIALLVVMGLIAAGVSTLEGLIQSVSTTITTDILRPLFGKHYPSDEAKRGRFEVRLNRLVIAVVGVVSILVSYQQIVSPKLSVIIFAQNGVYLFFGAAFVPVLFGTFLRNVPKVAPIAASLTAVVVHIALYFGHLTPYTQPPVGNPGVASAIGILGSVVVGLVVLRVARATATHRRVATNEAV